MRASSQTNEPQTLGDPDTQLMLRVGADEPGAFEQLVGRYRQRLFSFLNGLLDDNNDAEDLAQEVFLRAPAPRIHVKFSLRSISEKAKLSTNQ